MNEIELIKKIIENNYDMLLEPTGNEILDVYIDELRDEWDFEDDEYNLVIFKHAYEYYKDKIGIDDNVCNALFNKQKLWNLFYLMYYDEHLYYNEHSYIDEMDI